MYGVGYVVHCPEFLQPIREMLYWFNSQRSSLSHENNRSKLCFEEQLLLDNLEEGM